MKVCIKRIDKKSDEQVVIECVEVTPDIESIQSYVLTKGTTLTGTTDQHIHQFNLDKVFYFEAIDERVFAYTKDVVYELKIRLYELEEAYKDKYFVRCSKSFIINLMELESISPELNGRFIAHMKNNEKIIISRLYVKKLKNIVMGGK